MIENACDEHENMNVGRWWLQLTFWRARTRTSLARQCPSARAVTGRATFVDLFNDKASQLRKRNRHILHPLPFALVLASHVRESTIDDLTEQY